MAPAYKVEDRVVGTTKKFFGKIGTIKRIEEGDTRFRKYFVLLDDDATLEKVTAHNFKKKELDLNDNFCSIPDKWETSSCTSNSDSETSIQAYSDSEEETEYYHAQVMAIDSEEVGALKRKFEEMNTGFERVPKKVKIDEMDAL